MGVGHLAGSGRVLHINDDRSIAQRYTLPQHTIIALPVRLFVAVLPPCLPVIAAALLTGFCCCQAFAPAQHECFD